MIKNTLTSCLLLLAVTLTACTQSNDSGDGFAQVVLTASPIALPEGDDGELTQMKFKLTSVEPIARSVSIFYQTTDETAIAGQDYTEQSGFLTLEAGTSAAFINVPIIGDSSEEDGEYFSLHLSTADIKVRLTSPVVNGFIANDDSACVLPFIADPNPWLVNGEDPLNYAHRGGVIDFPENTLYAYKEVARANADVLEMDVYQTADNQLVILHDLDVDRTTNGTGNVGDLTLAELKELDAAYWFVTGQGTPHDADTALYEFRGIATGDKAPPEGYTADDFKIPTLEEALMAFPDKLINVELKPDLDDRGDYARQIADTLVRYGRFDNLIAASFVDSAAQRFKQVAPCIHTSVPLDQATSLVLGSFGDGVFPPVPEHVAFQVPPDTSQVQQVPDGITVVTQDLVDDAHAVNMAVQVWTINDCQQMLAMIDYGVDAIMTDRPLLLEQVLAQPKGQRSCDGL